MLKRRRTKIQKYISILKKKQLKKNNIQNHLVLKNKIQHLQNPPKIQQQNLRIEVEENEVEKPCWVDPHNENQNVQTQQILLEKKNKFRKFINFGMGNNTNVDQYENKLSQFYKKKYNKINWAQQAEDIEEKDINDYLNEDIYFSDKKPASTTVKYFAKTSEKHESVVSGLDWHKNIMFTVGLDNKLKVWHFQPNQSNPELKLKQQKDIYMEDLPLSNCFYRDNSLLAGSLRKNFVIVDTQKWKPTFITSVFLKQHKNYQNFRISTNNGLSAIFTQQRLSLLDKNNVYAGSLLANQNIQDICFSSYNQNSIFAVTNDSIYEWDCRKLQIVKMQKKYLGFTSIAATQTSLNIGSKLGTVYIYNINNFNNPLQNNNLVTHITQVKVSKKGNYSIALSKWKANAIRVIDSTSGRAVGEWPGVKTKVGIPMQAGFNQSDYFGVGGSHGHISLYGFSSQII